MAKSKSKLKLSQRREKAFSFFARGYTNTDVAAELKVHPDTVAGYRKLYEENLHAQAAANPGFLKDVLTNTIRNLAELDHIKAEAWKHMEPRKTKTTVECPHCEENFSVTETIEVSDQTRVQYLNVALKAQDQRSKLFGVLGIKQEVFAAVMQVSIVQQKLMEWMMEHLDNITRDELATFMEKELGEYLGNNPLAAIDSLSDEGAAMAALTS